MYNNFLENLPCSSLHSCRIQLHISWISGLIFGIALSCGTDPYLPLMRGALVSDVSIVGLGAVVLLPYLLTAFAVLISRPRLLLLLAFCKALLFGVCGAMTVMAFGSAGWIVRILLFFSDLAGMPVLYWLWLCCLDRTAQGFSGVFTAALVWLILISGIDYWMIAPFLASMI